MKQPNVDKMLAEIDTGQLLEWAAFYKVREQHKEALRAKAEEEKKKKKFFSGIFKALTGKGQKHEGGSKGRHP